MTGLLAELPRRAFLDWVAYHELEPWDQDRADLRSAIVAATLANVFRQRGQPPRRVRDFLAYRGPRQPMSQAKLELFKSLMRNANGDARKPDGQTAR